MLAALLCLVLWQGPAPEEQVVRVGDEVRGALTLDDAVVSTDDLLRVGRPASPQLHGRRFRLEVDEPGFVTIDLVSDDFDAFLVARDPDGSVLDEDDDGLQALDARLVLPLSGDDDVLLDVCALHDGAGSFRLRVLPGRAPRRPAEPWDDPVLREWRGKFKQIQAGFGARATMTAGGLNSLGAELRRAGYTLEALRVGQRALATLEAAVGPDAPLSVWTATNVALCEAQLGHVAVADARLARAIEVLADTPGADPVELAELQAERAALLRVVGALDEAWSLQRASLAVLEQQLAPDDRRLLQALNHLAVLEDDRGRPEVALALNERVLEVRRGSLPTAHPELLVSMSNVASSLRHFGHDERALALTEQALAQLEATADPAPLLHSSLLSNLACQRHSQGRLDEARALFRRSVACLHESLGPGQLDEAEVLLWIAWGHLDQGDAEQARQVLDEALAICARQLGGELGSFAEADGRLALDQIWRTCVHTRLAPALVDDEASARAGYEALLAWKGLSLGGTRRGRAGLRAAGSTSALLGAQLAELAGQLSRAARGLVSGRSPPSASELAAMLDERMALERELALADVEATPLASDWSSLRDALPPASALVDVFLQSTYVPGGPGRGGDIEGARYVAWITRPGESAPRRVDLGPREALVEAVAAFRAELLGGDRGRSVRADANSRSGRPTRPDEDLSRLLWAPLASQLEGVSTVLVSSDGELSTIPFAVLREADGRHVVETRTVVHVIEPGALTSLEQPAPPRRRERLLALGDVAFGAERPGSASGDGPLPQAWPPLPASAAELAAVVARQRAAEPNSQVRVLSGAEADEASLKRALPGQQRVHLATHAYVDLRAAGAGDEGAVRRLRERHPALLAGLVCAGANGPVPVTGEDGLLTAEELSWLDLSAADLVVLSACDTGLGRAAPGHGLLGLRRAFLVAGARTVVSSLWSVPDQDTARLMERFYDELQHDGSGVALALARAQRQLIAEQRATTGLTRPETWGAFVVDGDWR